MKCFVISPIDKDGSQIRQHADQVFKYLIEPALKQFSVEPVRSDHMSNPGKISDQMYRAIFEYDLCIVVLTYANPNVYYELAVAQSAGRPVIILLEKGTILPFDVRDFRCIEYDLTIPSYESRVHINRLIKSLNDMKDVGWRGDDVFRSYRRHPQVNAAVDPGPFEIRITSPAANQAVDIITVEGTYKELPPDYELRTLRYYPDQHGFVPHGNVVINRVQRTWKVNRFDVGGDPGDARGVEIALIGRNAKILLDYWMRAHEVHSIVMEKLSEPEKRGKWLPAIKDWPNDLVTCDRVEVRRK